MERNGWALITRMSLVKASVRYGVPNIGSLWRQTSNPFVWHHIAVDWKFERKSGSRFSINLMGGVHEPSWTDSVYSVLLVPKQNKIAVLPYINFSRHKDAMTTDTYPFPRIHDFVNRFIYAKVVKMHDASWGYWKVHIADSGLDMKTFTSNMDTFQNRRITEHWTFGILIAPSTV